jgi:hypothetical protein
MMTIDPPLNSVLSVLALLDASKAAIAKGLPTCEDLEDLFLDPVADKSKVESMLRLAVDTTIVSDFDIRRIMFVFDWFMVDIVDPNFAWSTFTRSAYVANKRARAVLKYAPFTTTPVSTSTAPISSTIDLSTDVLVADVKCQATLAVPGMVATLKPIEIDRSVDRLYSVPEKDPLPEELTLTELILQNKAFATHISECWGLEHNQYSPSSPATVCAFRNLMPADWGTQTNAGIVETLYDEVKAILDFH